MSLALQVYWGVVHGWRKPQCQQSAQPPQCTKSTGCASKTKGQNVPSDKWEAMALELSCLDDDALPQRSGPSGANLGLPQRLGVWRLVVWHSMAFHGASRLKAR
ncbi:unnamed protein product [Cladocopium goreaui]|uniref:Uncharacterized protein n=1 Tax=Cladocopium goreaui TaxID=2562237 RepID=A0A9P1GB58_9DINO|nr:unnamed protein product [Cladocopium goreaui]